MASWIDAITGPLKTAAETAQGLVEVRDTLKFSDAIIKLQAQILAAQQGAMSAQSHQTTLTEKIRDLEAQVAKFETWEAQKKRYHLQRLDPGVFFYALKQDMSQGEPTHYACPKCYEDRKRSVLHSYGSAEGLETFHCVACKSEWTTGRHVPSSLPTYPD